MITIIKTKVYKDKVGAFAARRLVIRNDYKAEVVKLAYPIKQYLLYVSGA